MDIARTLKEWRRRAGLSQEELGRLAGTHQQQVGRIELGQQVPRVDTLERLLAACGGVLEADRRLGASVDRGPIQELLARPPNARLGHGRGLAPRRTLRVLAGRRVRFVLAGAIAARLHGAPVPVREIEIVLEPGATNRRRLARAIESLRARKGPRMDAAPAAARFVADTPSGRLVALGRVPPPLEGYTELDAAASDLDVGAGRPARLSSIDDLIRIARASRRRDEREGAEILGALREELDPLSRS